MDGEGDDMGLPPFTNIYKLTDDDLTVLWQLIPQKIQYCARKGLDFSSFQEHVRLFPGGTE